MPAKAVSKHDVAGFAGHHVFDTTACLQADNDSNHHNPQAYKMPVIRLQGDAERAAAIYYEVDTDAPALGAGGMGQVYAGVRVDRHGNRTPVAIKFLFDDLGPGPIERSRREASIRIQNENLVEMYGFIEVTDQGGATHYHVVSELLEGVMLYDMLEGTVSDKSGRQVQLARELVDQSKTNPDKFAIRIVKAVLGGVMAMHDRRYIHRDIDPSNIMVTHNGRIKLIDYGIAKNLDSAGRREVMLTSTGQFMGKAAYAAPELITGDVEHQNETTDIYAIGIMLFQLLTGHVPFDGPHHEVLEMQMKKPLPLQEVKHTGLRRIIDRATRKRQAERYISAAEFRADLERVERGQPTSAGTAAYGKSGNGGGGSGCFKIAAIAIGAVFVLLAVAGAIWGITTCVANHEEDTGADTVKTEKAATAQEALEDDGSGINTVADAKSALGDPKKVQQAIERLKLMVENGPDASDAAVLLSLIYNHDLPQYQLEAVSQTVATDKALSYTFAKEAYELDGQNPRAVFCMAEKYYGGPGETNRMLERDMDMAVALWKKAADYAYEQNDGDTQSKALARLRSMDIDYTPGMDADEAADQAEPEEAAPAE